MNSFRINFRMTTSLKKKLRTKEKTINEKKPRDPAAVYMDK